MALGEGRARLLAERAHDAIVALVAEQHHAIEGEEGRAAFLLEAGGDLGAAVRCEVGEGTA